MENIYDNIIDNLSKSVEVVLVVVVKSSGSSPGKAGFKMAVSENGDVFGSLGGGVMEFNVIKECRQILEKNKDTIFIKKQEHKSTGGDTSSGLICSGIQWNAYYPLSKKDLDIFLNIKRIEQEEKRDYLVFTNEGIFISHKDVEFKLKEKEWIYKEQPGLKNTIYIFGGGHVSLSLSRIMKLLGFKVKVFDNRKDVETMKINDSVDEKFVIDYNNAGNYVPEGENVYVAVMTFAHKYDYIVIRQLTKKKVKYLGMMGSENKVSSVFEMLKGNDGADENLLKKIDAPIGIDINSETPSEIAISIAAKIVSIKNC